LRRFLIGSRARRSFRFLSLLAEKFGFFDHVKPNKTKDQISLWSGVVHLNHRPYVSAGEFKFGNDGGPEHPALLFGALNELVQLLVELADILVGVFWLGHFADPFAFGRSTRSSRNSTGPLVSRRRLWARSSGGADGSIILSIAFVASSDARAASNRWVGIVLVFTVSPSATRQRMALDRVVFLRDAHSSRALTMGAGIRAETIGSRPVAGRPLFFWSTFIDFFIFAVYQNSKTRGSCSFRPGSFRSYEAAGSARWFLLASRSVRRTKTTFVFDCCLRESASYLGWAHVSINGASDGRQLMPDDNRDLCEICWRPAADVDEEGSR
jgi:hypothetical protein